MTFAQHIDACLQAAIQKRLEAGQSAAREYSLAITALEDARMRYDRGLALDNGWSAKPVDLEKGDFT